MSLISNISICVCAYVCVCACVCVCVKRVRVFVCVYMCVCVCVHACVRMCLCVHMSVCAHVFARVHMCPASMCHHMCLHMFVHICLCLCIFVCICACSCVLFMFMCICDGLFVNCIYWTSCKVKINVRLDWIVVVWCLLSELSAKQMFNCRSPECNSRCLNPTFSAFRQVDNTLRSPSSQQEDITSSRPQPPTMTLRFPPGWTFIWYFHSSSIIEIFKYVSTHICWNQILNNFL